MPTIITGVASDETVSVKWVPTITDVNAPKLATEINAATSVTLECLLTETFSPDASAEVGEVRRMCSKQVQQRGGTVTLTIEDLIYAYDPQGLATAAINKAYAALVQGQGLPGGPVGQARGHGVGGRRQGRRVAGGDLLRPGEARAGGELGTQGEVWRPRDGDSRLGQGARRLVPMTGGGRVPRLRRARHLRSAVISRSARRSTRAIIRADRDPRPSCLAR